MSLDTGKVILHPQESPNKVLDSHQIHQIHLERPTKPETKRFIRPIDLNWFLRARAISPMAAVMACCLWYRYGLEQTATIKATRHKLQEFCITKTSSRRLLRHLEAAQLITVVWHKTRAPEVTLILQDRAGASSNEKEATP